MKKSKKFLCLLLALVMAGSLLLLPAAAANTQQSGAERYPTVYVHGDRKSTRLNSSHSV